MDDYLNKRLDRLEDQLSALNKSLELLARIDERMLAHMQEQQRLSVRIELVEHGIDKLQISRAKFVGGATTLATVGSFIGGFLKVLFFG